MANTTDSSTMFKTLAGVTILLLLTSAALVYLQSGGGNAGSAELAALSQAIPGQARQALSGEEDGFDRLDNSLQRLAELRRAAGGSAPGRSSDWQQFESQAAAILTSRAAVETLTGAAAKVADNAASIVSDAELLFDYSSSSGLLQEFQQRADRIRQSAAALRVSDDANTAATNLADEASFLRTVVDALAGEDTSLDVRPLGEAGLQNALMPIASSLVALEQGVAALNESSNQVSGLATAQKQLEDTAMKLLGGVAGSSPAGSSLPGFLAFHWIPIALVLVSVLLLGGMLLLHSRSAVFEKTARIQAEQNDRNQQAILRLLDEMGSLADGDLTVEATVTEDITGTIADSFNFAIEELRKLVATVNETAIMVDSAAKQTENTAAHLAKAAENQTREINAATESIVSMAGSIEEVSGNAERSSDVARHSVEVAHKGGEAVRRTIDGMNAIRETIQDTSKRIKRLGESSQEIGNIVELINDIAEQTNILALNASIQASMAGEAGRGFAVVADEVQRLAERSTNATKQIEVLVRTIQADTNEAVVSMERSTTDVVGGALLAENAGAALDEIEQVSNQIASLVQNISGSARQQAGSAADVTRRTTRLSEISEQTGKATTATAAAISKLAELATQLRRSVAGFTLPKGMMQTSALSAAPTTMQAPAANDDVKTG